MTEIETDIIKTVNISLKNWEHITSIRTKIIATGKKCSYDDVITYLIKKKEKEGQ